MTRVLPQRRVVMLSRLTAAITVVSLLMFTFPPQNAHAAALTTAYLRVSRQQESVLTGVSLTVFWKPASTATENALQIIFPDGDDGLWCRTNGALAFATTTIDAASDPTASAGTCAAGTGSSSYDTFSLTTANLTAGTLYGIVITGDTAEIGTAAAGAHVATIKTRASGPADVDTLSVSLRTIADDQISVTATVDPTLTVTLTPTTSVDLGILNSTNVNQASMTSAVTTNAPNGYVSTVLFNSTLTATGGNIPVANGTIAPGESEFGASTDDASTVDLATTSNSCATGTGTYNATALTTSAQVFASEAGAISGDTTTLCFSASVTGTQVPGSYTSTVTLVTTGKF